MGSVLKGVGGAVGIIGALVAGFGMLDNSILGTVGMIVACVGVLVFAVGSMLSSAQTNAQIE